MSLGDSILPIFEQLGMLEDFKKICLPCYSADMYNDKIEPVGALNMKGLDKLYVYQNTPAVSPPSPPFLSLSRMELPEQQQEKHEQEENNNMRNDREKQRNSKTKCLSVVLFGSDLHGGSVMGSMLALLGAVKEVVFLMFSAVLLTSSRPLLVQH
jgi:hypothetical protein